MFDCCCICLCISLKKGSLIFGIINLVLSLAVLICAPKADETSHLGYHSDHVRSFQRQCIYIFSVLTVVVSTLLIIAIIKMNSKLILAFLWIGFTQWVFFLPVCITFIIMASTSSGSSEDVLWTGVEFVIIPIIQSSFLLIIHHYYQELLNQADRRADYEPIE
ncbi:uncharacterized protein [Chelonus insularis]|uniref:uncharacterized protein n=1 Tax=Chelonus insularis TaxID=460826 RepID=UPI0015899B59|nr:uncharacterized protein LOC118071459 [Chelonus insularis]